MGVCVQGNGLKEVRKGEGEREKKEGTHKHTTRSAGCGYTVAHILERREKGLTYYTSLGWQTNNTTLTHMGIVV